MGEDAELLQSCADDEEARRMPKSKLIDKDHNFIGEDDSPDVGLGSMASRAASLIDEIEMRELELDQMKKELRSIQTETLPHMMQQAGSSTFTTLDGYELVKGLAYEGSLPKEPQKRAEAITYLEQRGAGDLVKSNVVIPFTKAELKEAMKLLVQLRQRGLHPNLVADVHHMTLKAWARGEMEDGREVNGEKIGLWIGDFVSISKKSQPKKRK